MNIKNFLNKKGYRTDFSNDEEKFHKTLYRLMGENHYHEFIQNEIVNEDYIVSKFVKDDTRIFKALLSRQIDISIEAVQEINRFLLSSKLKPHSVLELGSGDGWASEFLMANIDEISTIDLVDKYPYWKNENDKITIYNQEYSDFFCSKKYDFIFSILGAPLSNITELLDCVDKNLSENGMVALCLRISNYKDFKVFYELLFKYKLRLDIEYSKKIHANEEKLPLLFLSKSKTDIKFDSNEYFFVERKCFFNKQEPIRLFGFEAERIYTLLNKLKPVEHSRYSFDNGDFTVEIFCQSDILYRISKNPYDDLILEYPVLLNDEFNNAESQIERINSDDDFFNSINI